MRKIQKAQQPEENNFYYGPARIPQGKFAAGYLRQSTKDQAEKYHESAEMQLDEVYRIAKRLGIEDVESYVIIYIENRDKDGKIKNASGRLRIDQREGLQALVLRIKSGEVKVVIVFREDRLFRDESLIQPLTFADICKQNNCLIATPHYTYDFNRNRFDLQLFVQKAIESASFLKDYITQQLHGGRDRVALRGEYDGRPVLFGYMFEKKPYDSRTKLARKPLIYKRNAEIVQWVFLRFYELGNDFALLYREVYELPYLFPAYPREIEEKYEVWTNAKLSASGGYVLSRVSLFELLTNPMYAGHWTFSKVVVKYNNHDPIVDQFLFRNAYDALAFTTLDGEPNERRIQKTNGVRYHQYGKAPYEALLKNALQTEYGKIHLIPMHARKTEPGDKGESYTALEYQPKIKIMYSLSCQPLDNIFVARLFEMASEPYFSDILSLRLKEQQEKKVQALVSVEDQINIAKQQIETHKATLDLPPPVLDRQTREETAIKLKQAREVLAALESKQEDHDTIREEDVKEYTSVLQQIQEAWPLLPLKNKRKLISLVTTRIYLQKLTQHWFLFSITWYGPYGGEDVAFLWRGMSSFSKWTDDENELLGEHYPTAPSMEILQLLPDRTWKGVIQHAKRKGVKRVVRLKEPDIENATLADLEIMQDLGIDYELPETMLAKWSGIKRDTSSPTY